MKHLMFLFVLVLMFVTTNVNINAQEIYSSSDSSYLEQFRGKGFNSLMPGKVWVKVCDLNHDRFIDSNSISIGDTILLPLGRIYVALDGDGKSNQWNAAMWFVDMVVVPYLNNKPAVNVNHLPNIKQKDIAYLIFIGLFILALIAGLIDYFFSNKEKKNLEDRNLFPFIEKVPALDAPDDEVIPLVRESLENVYGDKFEIIGEIERGVANGKQIMFHLDGTTTEENFVTEPAFKAKILFPGDNKTKTVVCRWSCFNPIFGTTNGDFYGTFRREDSNEEKVISQISKHEIRETSENIRRISRLINPIFPLSVKEKKENPVEKTTLGSDNFEIMKFTKLQLSHEKGLNIEGEFSMKIKDLKEIISSFTAPKNK